MRQPIWKFKITKKKKEEEEEEERNPDREPLKVSQHEQNVVQLLSDTCIKTITIVKPRWNNGINKLFKVSERQRHLHLHKYSKTKEVSFDNSMYLSKGKVLAKITPRFLTKGVWIDSHRNQGCHRQPKLGLLKHNFAFLKKQILFRFQYFQAVHLTGHQKWTCFYASVSGKQQSHLRSYEMTPHPPPFFLYNYV